MSQKNNKSSPSQSSDGSSGGSPVLEGEIIDEPMAAQSSDVSGEKKGLGRFVGFSVLLVVLGIGGWFGLPFVKSGLGKVFPSYFSESNSGHTSELALSQPEPSFSAEAAFKEVTIVNAQTLVRVTALENKLAGLEQAQKVVVSNVDASLLERVDSLERGVAVINATMSVVTNEVGDDVQAIDIDMATNMVERISALEAAQTQSQLQTDTVVVSDAALFEPSVSAAHGVTSEANYFMSLVSLSRAVSSGKPYQNQLLVLEASAKAQTILDAQEFNNNISSLRAYSKKGVPTDKDIVASFRSVSKQALVAEARTIETSWWQKLWSSIKGLVTVRQRGDLLGDGIEEKLARAEVRIERGDYGEAQAILVGTTLAEQQALAPLLDMLTASIVSQKAVNDLITQGIEGQDQ